jgi:3-hydroxyisobutyrate dehydrogenase-like beta-hydroxyacid dehydrogenase
MKDLVNAAKIPKVEFFDMPMTGSRIGAETGQLTLFVGGDEDELNKIRPDLKAIAKDVKYFGKAGSGTKYKLVLNTLQAIHIVGFGEAMRLAKSVGLDERLTAETLNERPGGVITGIAKDSYFKKPENVTFSVDWITKDLDYATKMVKSGSYPLLEDVLAEFIKIQKNHGEEDWTEVNRS